MEHAVAPLSLPASCAERAEDAEVVYGLTTLTSLGFYGKKEDGMFVEEAGEWVLDLSRLPTLTWLRLAGCYAVTVKEVLALRNVTSLTYLGLSWCYPWRARGCAQ